MQIVQEQPFWVPHAPVVRHSSEAVSKLLSASETKRSGASIKSLCLAAHVTAKKATFALTVQTLRCGFVSPRTDVLSPAFLYSIG